MYTHTAIVIDFGRSMWMRNSLRCLLLDKSTAIYNDMNMCYDGEVNLVTFNVRRNVIFDHSIGGIPDHWILSWLFVAYIIKGMIVIKCNPVLQKHYLFGGNPGKDSLPKMRLDDFWSLQVTYLYILTINTY